MPEEIDSQFLRLLGQLALAQSLAFNARMRLEDLMDEHELRRVTYSDQILKHIRGGMKELEHAEFAISDSIYSTSTGVTKKQKQDNDLTNNGDI